ncbi:MAG: hypothetical protein ABEI77_00870 [Halorientalis sp.]
MDQLELGEATIVYEDPKEGRTEMTVDNEELLYAQDHWVLPVGTDEEGNDLMRHLPRDRVHHVDRNVEQFEEEVATIRHRVESIARDLQDRLPVDIPIGGQGRPRTHTEQPPSTSTTVQIDTEDVDESASEPDEDAKETSAYEEQAEES